MKRFLYILFISSTVIFSFGFRGCEGVYCNLIARLIYATNANLFIFAGGEDGIHRLNTTECVDLITLGTEGYANYIRDMSLGLEQEGMEFLCSVGDSGLVVWSSDGGTTWEDRSIPGLTKNLYGFDFVNYASNNIQAVVCGESGTIYKSTDSSGGYSWQNLNPPVTENLNSIGVIGQTFFIAVGEKGTIVRTTDAGQTWHNRNVGDTSAHFNRLFLKPSLLYYNKGWAVADNGKIYATTDYGNTWFPQNSQVTTNLYDIIFKNENEGIVVGEAGVVRYTTNGGAAWLEDSYFNGLTDGDIISITGIDSSTATALIRGGTDNPGGTTMLTVSSEPLSSNDNENDIPSEYELLQNYPNPFNPSTTIQYTVADAYYASAVRVRLVVFDVLGSEVATLVDEEKPAGTYEVVFNTNELPSGVYFYRLTAGNFSQSKKLVLIK